MILNKNEILINLKNTKQFQIKYPDSSDQMVTLDRDIIFDNLLKYSDITNPIIDIVGIKTIFYGYEIKAFLKSKLFHIICRKNYLDITEVPDKQQAENEKQLFREYVARYEDDPALADCPISKSPFATPLARGIGYVSEPTAAIDPDLITDPASGEFVVNKTIDTLDQPIQMKDAIAKKKRYLS
ncbi:hypothetical protein FC83_GL002926 [Agrilactobacillus composti DSM 18527 = JCM 14202]|uniref:Uncharacterized protein n=1 Tax=Agrilactobacillus composti DSM 18527 = JCM 14202 TaxID=1423734 RepID=A0A0R1XTA3_9LACO|nr:hypothetical protein [Agrilactobacillus composti]KRM33358.1 hypothetical protein FC83_GL002926 [Agrilactobacillus composti DSM 18527 = JCM 14202]